MYHEGQNFEAEGQKMNGIEVFFSSTANGRPRAITLRKTESFPLLQLLLCAICLLLNCSSPSRLVASAPPDVVVFLTDDNSQLDCSPYGGVGIQTPHMQDTADKSQSSRHIPCAVHLEFH